jgi:hypothetical protein
MSLHSLYRSPRTLKCRKLKWAGHVSRLGVTRNAYRILVWKPLSKWLLGKLRMKLMDNIKMDLKDICCEDGRWFKLAQDVPRSGLSY